MELLRTESWVWWEVCERSISMPSLFISVMMRRPRGVRPPGRYGGAGMGWSEEGEVMSAASAKALWQFQVRVAARTPRVW